MGILYIVDSDNFRIRKADTQTGIITTVVGDGFKSAGLFRSEWFAGDDRPATRASPNNPNDVFLDCLDNLYISDQDNHRFRKVYAQTGIINAVAGDGFKDGVGRGRFSGDGNRAIDASLWYSTSVFVDGSGNLYIADTFNQRIRKVAGLATPSSLEVGVFAPVAGTTTKTPDFNGDGKIDFADFVKFVLSFGKIEGDAGFDAKYEGNDSGSVDFGDFIQFAQNFGKSVGGGKPATSAPPEK